MESEDLFLNKNENLILSNFKTKIMDNDNNLIFLDNFKYNTKSNFFKSIGEIEVNDKNNNTYKFSQIFIDTKKKEIVGTDIRYYLNQQGFKINTKNNPRFSLIQSIF